MDSNQKKVACLCCHNITLPQDSRYEICPVCSWESDPIQNDGENYNGGANTITLKQARLNYQEFGAIESAMQKNVRPPLDSEIPK
jgi:Cysteine-rich CPCC